MSKSYVWVIGFDKTTGQRMEFTGCPVNNAEYYKAVYENRGYEVRIISEERAKQIKVLDNIKQID